MMPNPAGWLAENAAWLPLIVFVARICDVSIGTIRTICVVRGMRLIAACLGFFEVLIWVTAISGVITHLDKPLSTIAYAAGFATGNWVGMWLEGQLALGHQVVRLISYDRDNGLAGHLRQAGYVVTELEGHGRDAPVKICFVAAPRRVVPDLLQHATRADPQVFATIEDVRSTNREVYHHVPNKGGWRAVMKKK
jgi:uncharacterized protein YebE (UPF0316 family)